MGGRGIEREVSFNSGRTICDHLDAEKYTALPIFQRTDGILFILPWKFVHRGKISDFEHRLDTEAQKISWDDLARSIDFAYIAMHGRFAEDGTLQGMLSVLKIPYLGSKIFGSALGMNKALQKKFLEMAGILVPRGIVVRHAQKFTLNLPYPVIVKPVHEGSSLGVSIARNESELTQAIWHAAHVHANFVQDVIVEEYVVGMEFSCIILTDYRTNTPLPLEPTEIIPDAGTIFTYEQKYMPGRATKYTPARCAPEIRKKIQDTCIAAAQALEIKTIARIDGFVTNDERIIITDPNTLSGMAPSSFAFVQAAQHNMTNADLINHLIATELHDL